MVIADILGVPHDHREPLHRWSIDMILSSNADQTPEEQVSLMSGAIAGMTASFEEIIAERRVHPQDDIIGTLVEAYDSKGHLTVNELIGTCILLLIAGHETTVNLFGNGLLTLLTHPDQFILLKENPNLMTSAVEEVLRFESPVQQGTYRVTTAPLEICGTTIGAGEQILALIGSANRDPEQFPDPDRFDIERAPNRHLGFGLGIHHCLGAHLARIEARIGFTRLLERLPGMVLANANQQAEHPNWKSNVLMRGLSKLISRQSNHPVLPVQPNWRANPVVRSLQSLHITW
jgi:cytochrome P450